MTILLMSGVTYRVANLEKYNATGEIYFIALRFSTTR